MYCSIFGASQTASYYASPFRKSNVNFGANVCQQDTLKTIYKLASTFDKNLTCFKENMNTIRTALNKYSIDTEAAQFVEECLSCIEKNLYNKRLYDYNICGIPVVARVLTEKGVFLVQTMQCALSKALNPKSKFNINTKEKEGLQKCIAESRKFIEQLN